MKKIKIITFLGVVCSRVHEDRNTNFRSASGKQRGSIFLNSKYVYLLIHKFLFTIATPDKDPDISLSLALHFLSPLLALGEES